MSDELTNFENQHMAAIANYALLDGQIKQAKEKLEQLKRELTEAMDQYDIKSIDNDYIKITRVASSNSTSVDLKKLQKEEAKLYVELLEDYPKVTKRNASLRIVVKS